MACDYCKTQPVVKIPAVSYFGGAKWSTTHGEVAPHGLLVIYDNDRWPVCKMEIRHCPMCGRALG